MGVKGGPKTGGRKKGTPNKSAVGLNESLEKMLMELYGTNAPMPLIEAIGIEIKHLPADKRMHVYMELMQYVHAKRKAIEVDATLSAQVQAEFVYEAEFGTTKKS